MQEFDDVTFNYLPYSVQNSGGPYSANAHSFQPSKPYPASGQVRSHNTYGYAYAVWSPWEVPNYQAPPMMATSQIRSSAGHVAVPAMFHLPPPYPAETSIENTPINREMDYWDLSSPQDNSSPSLSSDTTSSPSPRLPSPPAQQPLIIHQPRPYRRIPIISLTQLASACEEDNNRLQSDSTLSPLPFEYLDFNMDPSQPGLHQPISQYTLPGPASSQPFKSQPTEDQSINLPFCMICPSICQRKPPSNGQGIHCSVANIHVKGSGRRNQAHKI